MAQLTLPAEMRRALKVEEGDYLEAKVVKNGVLLRPVAVVARERAWQRMTRAASQVKDLKPNPREDITAEEERIAAEVKAFRRTKRRHA
jgi:bifunctional DNA-binding transcriptional regulator/antitoxin component of YhaV-PrlF toxin-antitoxin module